MTASDPRSPAKARSTGQAPSLLPPAVRQALEHPGPFALGLDAWLAAECGATRPQELAAAVRARQLELLNADLCHMAMHSPLFHKSFARLFQKPRSPRSPSTYFTTITVNS